ncbi:MAG TPA: Lrp/AsnC family transcriptional regulator [Candidatus Faeciplasma avium]|uniref:Lrp/AsnC family transcriptional regulator n=1 Tax=Candidatus Faeciplasma avium TaxID=2840798 RepID=A0A9D1NSC9_9FIRM|nr:Lrp/AsnC family transcriptional regulator [Candidatus Faeciplasma avium]
MDKLIKLLKQNARLSSSDLACMLDTTKEDIESKIETLEKSGVIRGYTAIVVEEVADKDSITAYIELSVTPKAQVGYDEIARTIAEYKEVESISLMSGGYDLAVTVRCKNIKEVSLFVSQRLATIDGVISTSTHFFLQKYKENGILLVDESPDERGND